MNLETNKNGFAVIDKQAGWTSHDVVAKARGIFGTKKVGHSGTLDPPATGVLVLGIGKGTRLLRFLTDLRKEYVATMVLGAETDTLDAEGKVISTSDIRPTYEMLQEVSSSFVGVIKQVPPMVSAVKVDGKRLYEHARQGREIERKPREVVVHKLSITETSESNIFSLNIECGSGTYVRSLVSDIAQAVGSVAHVGTLRRTAVGSFNESHAKLIDRATMIGLTEGLKDYEMIEVSDKLSDRIKVGSVIKTEELSPVDIEGPWAIIDKQQNLLAMYEKFKSGMVKPAVVVPQEN